MALTPSPAAPATPLTQPLPATHETPTTGTWRHPRFDEIARRQNAASFTDRNIRKALVNAALLVGTWIMARAVKNRYDGGQPRSSFITIDLDSSNTSTVQILAAPVHLFISYSPYSIWALRLFLLFNIVMAFYPLIRPPDDLADIPLTPTQRARLGLSPTPMTPTTPSGQYITPPRYPRSATPQSGTPNSTKSRYSNSPYSANGSPSVSRMPGGSPYTPSPLLQKAMGEGARRNSYGSPSPLGASYTSLVGTPATPSPTSGRGTGIGLSSRWLYERGRNSPSSPRLYN